MLLCLPEKHYLFCHAMHAMQEKHDTSRHCPYMVVFITKKPLLLSNMPCVQCKVCFAYAKTQQKESPVPFSSLLLFFFSFSLRLSSSLPLLLLPSSFFFSSLISAFRLLPPSLSQCSICCHCLLMHSGRYVAVA